MLDEGKNDLTKFSKPDENITVIVARLHERYKALDAKLDYIIQIIDTQKKQIEEINRWKHEEIGFNRGAWKTSLIFGAIIGTIIGYLISLFLNN